MVLTRSRSNNQGTTAPTAASAPKTLTPAKRKSGASAMKASKAVKLESTTDVATAKETNVPATSDPVSVDSVEAQMEKDAVAPTVPAIAPTEDPTVSHGAAATEAIQPYDAVVSDIEGTTTPIVFVKDNLFPYVTSKLPEFLKRNWSSEEMKSAIEALRAQAAKDVADGLPDATLIETESAEAIADKIQQDVIASIGWQMKADRKIGALKAFQGYMWREGYANGDLKGEIYKDVIPAFDQWKKEEKKLYIYSSGSIAAQKLLFKFSEKGDLLHYFSGHYDTTIGPKVEAESYTKIASDIGLNPNRILFLSDNIHEIVAAKKAGFQAVIIDRPGNAILSEEDRKSHIVVKSFLDIPKPQQL